MPVTAIKSTLEAIASTVRPGTVITDTASTKQQVLAWAEQILPPGVHFVGGHPITGADAAGIEGASADLFRDKIYCLMPARTAGGASLETMTNLVQLVGARPFFLDPLEHDAFVAAVSHVPFLAATALVRMAAGSVSWPEIRRVAGADFERAFPAHDGRSPDLQRRLPDQQRAHPALAGRVHGRPDRAARADRAGRPGAPGGVQRCPGSARPSGWPPTTRTCRRRRARRSPAPAPNCARSSWATWAAPAPCRERRSNVRPGSRGERGRPQKGAKPPTEER